MTQRKTEAIQRTLVRYLSVRSSYGPTFSYDDRRLVYVSDTTGVPQVWSVDLEDGAPQQLTHFEDRVGFVSSAKKSDSFVFGKDHGGDERFQLFSAKDGANDLTQLTDSPDVIHDFGGWSPDEGSILFSSNARDRAFFDVYTMQLSTGRPRFVHRSDHTNYGVGWSPDGRSVLLHRVHAPFNHDLFLVGAKGGAPSLLTQHKGDATFTEAQFSPDGRIYLVTDLGREFAAPAVVEPEGSKPDVLVDSKWDVEELELSDDGRRLAFTSNVDGLSRLIVWEAPGPQVEVKTPSGVITGLKWSHGGRMLAFAFSGANHNQDVWVHDLGDGSTRRVTKSSASGLPLKDLSPPKLFRFTSFDGLSIPCFFYDAGGSGAALPAVVYIHGGPEAQFRPGFNPVVQFFASVGMSVVAPNVRGSTGYGRTYTHLDDVRLRMNSVADIESMVKHLEEGGRVDPRKVGVLGGSYGGFMVLACMYRYPRLWAAGVDIVGISNFVTFLKRTGPWRRKLRAAEYGDPQKDREFLDSISPLNNASKITAPLFMIHGTNDPRVPFGETRQIERALKKRGRTVEVMVFEDEGHGLVKLKNRIRGYTAATDFLLRHLLSRR